MNLGYSKIVSSLVIVLGFLSCCILNAQPVQKSNLLTENGRTYLNVHQTEIDTYYGRMQFYEKADLAGFHLKDKRDLFQDSLLLILPEDEKDAIGKVDRIINDVLRIKDLNGPVIQSKLNEYSKEWIKKVSETDSPLTSFNCEDAQVFCGSGTYGYNAGVNAGNAQVGPDYDCLGNQPNPAWFFCKSDLRAEM